MGFDYINPHAEIPLFKAATEAAKGFLEKGASFVAGVVEGAAMVADSALAGIGSVASSVSNISLSKGADVAVEHAPKIEAPQIQKAIDPHHVDIAELGSFSPPSFGNAVGGQGIGRG